MPGGFWIFLLIVVANLVITIIKKAAEKKAKAAGESAEASPSSPGEAPRRRFTGEGDHEMVLERAGDDRLRVIDILRKELRWDLPTAMTLAGTTPSVVATGLTRSEAGYLRNRFESVGAGVSLRRRRSESVSTARDLDLGRFVRIPTAGRTRDVRRPPRLPSCRPAERRRCGAGPLRRTVRLASSLPWRGRRVVRLRHRHRLRSCRPKWRHGSKCRICRRRESLELPDAPRWIDRCRSRERRRRPI